MNKMFTKLVSLFTTKDSNIGTSTPPAPVLAEKDEAYYSRIGWLVLIGGLGGFMLWATFAPLDKGVSAQGVVITDGQRKIVQPVGNGVIDEILVRDGDQVEAGQLLVKMNDVQAVAQTEGALEAIGGLQGQIRGLELSIAAQKEQLKFLSAQSIDMKTLAQEGYIPRNRYLEIERIKAQVSGQLAENQGNLLRQRHQLEELQKKLPAYEFDLSNVTIESPVAGQVINLAIFTKGQVVQSGTKLMEIVPTDRPLIVEAKLPVNLIDKVHPGLPVQMIFAALNQRITPSIPGVVTIISSDRTTDERTGEAFYKMQAQVTDKGILALKDSQVRAGMPVEIFVVTGERTLMNYLLRPFFDRMRTSLGEE
jgi:membrane fusion protein, protease secretion system